MTVVRFDDASAALKRLLTDFATTPGLVRLVAVRDLAGRLRFAVDGDNACCKALADRVSAGADALGAWLPPETTTRRETYGRILTRQQLFDAPQVFDSPDRVEVAPKVFLLDRRVIAADWQRGPLPNDPPAPPRAAFYALKGGAGRSTALVYWVRHLARDLGKKVLVVDLDLESPGVSAALLPLGRGPRFGVVDWYVEEAVGQADADLLAQMTAQSPLAEAGPGSIHVAPVAGDSSDYLAKLARVYASPPGAGDRGAFGARTGRLIDDLERTIRPDVTVIDSRAGLHDVGAVSIVRLGATAFLFATATEESWLGYRYMFEAWGKRREVVREFRENLQIVASLVPEVGGDDYVARVRERAHTLFTEWIYDDAGVDDPFNFNERDATAPHAPLPVMWGRRFFAHDPLGPADERFEAELLAHFGDFIRRADELVLG